MSFEDLEAGKPLASVRKMQEPSQAVTAGVFQINTAVSTFQRLVNTLDTPRETLEIRDRLMLMWEDGFCRGRIRDCLDQIDGEDPILKSFWKMSIQLYNYGEGLMEKVPSYKCHKWVFKEPSECEPNASNY